MNQEDRVREAADRLLNHFSGHQSQPGTQREVVERELRTIAALPVQPTLTGNPPDYMNNHAPNEHPRGSLLTAQVSVAASAERDRALEEAAKIAEDYDETECHGAVEEKEWFGAGERTARHGIATAIRAMKGGDGWQPVESAPTGARVLAYVPWWDGPSVELGVFDEDGFKPTDRAHATTRPKAWMPIPSPPGKEG